MLLDYERYQRKSKKKKSRFIVFIVLLAAFGFGTYFLVSTFLRDRRAFDALTLRAPEERLDDLWSRLLRIDREATQEDARDEKKRAVLDELLRLSGDYLHDHPLALKPLLYHGFGSFYRGLYEPDFDAQLPYFNQSIVSQRRALTLAGEHIRPQLYYLLGRVYFHKRNAYYDLAAKYLEKAVELGYKQADAYEYLVLVYEEWGVTEKTISYLEQAYAEKKNDLYLYYLAKSYKKVNRFAEALDLLNRVKAVTRDAELMRECTFLLGEILFEQGSYTQAERHYRAIIAGDDNSAEAHFRLALIYEKLGDYARYRYELRLTLEKDRGHSGARSRL